MTGVVAALPFTSRFTGDGSLSSRPMRRLTAILERMGARFEFEGADGLPMLVHGSALADMKYVNESGSAQIKSALLLAGLVSGATVRVAEPRRSRDHTENMLAALGANLSTGANWAEIAPTERIAPLDIVVPADPSSAAFFAALAAMRGDLTVVLPNVCLNPTRTGFFGALKRMGASIDMVPGATPAAGEITGEITVRGGTLSGIDLTAPDIPALVDELPLIACLASCAKGETRVSGAAELRLKESDRIASVVANLRAVGAEIDELPDGFVVRGTEGAKTGSVVTHGDHRIAMAFAVLGAIPGNTIVVDDRECVSVSFPGFWTELGAIHAASREGG